MSDVENIDAPTNLASLKNRRKYLKGEITHFKTLIDKFTENPDYDRIKDLVESTATIFAEFDRVQQEIEDEDVETDYLPYRLEVQDAYYDTLSRAKKLIRAAANTAGLNNHEINRDQPSPAQSALIPRKKLPELTPPKFDGQLENWATFKARFIALIHNNENLSDSEKLDYLQAALSGKAARAIEALDITDNNYTDAWDILTKKYDNTRKAILRHWDLLNSITPLQRETPEAIEELLDVVRQQVRAMKNLGQPIGYWDTPLIYVILSKIGKNTAYQWEITLEDNKMPTYTSLIEFLNKRADCVGSTRGPGTSNNGNKSKPFNKSKGSGKKDTDTQHAHVTTAATFSCPICKEAHSIYKCSTFKELAVDERIKAAQRVTLCLNCLRGNHKTKECKNERKCGVCQKQHNTMLHLGQAAESPEAHNA